MGMFFPDEPNRFPEIRPTGFSRYKQLLERDWKQFFLTNLLTLAFLLPFGLGMGYAVLSSSVLVLIPVCILGGAIAGMGIAGMYDRILRSLRDNRDDWWYSYKRAMKQNWRAALLPGVLECTFLGFFIFACYMRWVSTPGFSLGTLAILAASALLCLVLFSIWWPQIVLFDQKPGIQIKNCILFTIQNFWLVLKVSALQLVWWLAFVIFLPWTAFLVPILGVWYLWFLSCFFLYDRLDDAFHIEEQILAAFPEQAPTQEDAP